MSELPSAQKIHLATLYEKPCWLRGHGACQGKIEAHHLISKGQARGNKRVRKLIDHLKIPVCQFHNMGKWADTRWARKVLLQRFVEEIGEGWLQEFIDALPWKYQPRWLTFDGILDGPEPPSA